MRITGTGHASVFIETAHGTILTDPWVNPAYFGSWFPFPDNSAAAGLDWDRFGQADYLFVSHLHRDHFDPEHLRRYISKKTTVLLPDYPTDELEDALRDVGFTSFVQPASEEVVDLDGLQIMIQSLTSPTDGPIGDSSLWVYDGVQRLLNQNDARPSSLSAFTELGPIDSYLVQFSGAIWFPMVYELPTRAKQALGLSKRERQFDRTLRYIEECGARFVFPTAGPPCFLDEELWGFNDIFGDESNIFPDQTVYLAWLAEQGHDEGRLLLPGTVADVDAPDCPVEHPYDPATIYASNETKTAYLRDMQARRLPEVTAAKATWAHPEIDVLAALTEWFTPLLEESTHIAAGINGGIRFTCEDDAARRRRHPHRLRRPRGACVRGGEGALPLPHPAGVRRAAHRRARDRLGQLAVPVLPVQRAPHRRLQRVHLRLLQVPVRGTAAVRRGLVHRGERRRGDRDGAADRGRRQRLGRAEALPAPEGRAVALRRDRGHRPQRSGADLPDARLEVAAGRRQVHHLRRRQAAAGRAGRAAPCRCAVGAGEHAAPVEVDHRGQHDDEDQ